MNERRVRVIQQQSGKSGPVVYWMSREQRTRDNWALVFAQELALKRKQALLVIFCLAPHFLGATWRQYDFMLQGLEVVEGNLKKKGISFILLTGEPSNEVPTILRGINAGALVCDFDPLRVKRRWKEEVSVSFDGTIYEVDAHNVVPCWIASSKKEYAARTFRTKFNQLLPEFLEEYPPLGLHAVRFSGASASMNWPRIAGNLSIDRSVPPVAWIAAGEEEAIGAMYEFIDNRLGDYDTGRNDPTLDVTSRLSPYLHFGMLSAQRVALEVFRLHPESDASNAFLEQLLVRQELADNFCYYEEQYDSVEGFPDWARRTLEVHRADKREYIYPMDMLERAQTHDALWNAAQICMVETGWMHGYMRMYWAKKILEWSSSVKQGLEVATYLNDRYQLDGCDPNGYVGIAWSIGGVHDRPWKQRPIFGSVRYMNYRGARRKFDVDKYINSGGQSESIESGSV